MVLTSMVLTWIEISSYSGDIQGLEKQILIREEKCQHYHI